MTESTPAHRPAVSVIIAVHDGAEHIRTALDSVLASTWRDLELILVDDASSDDTVAVARACVDPRLSVHVLPENVGVAGARDAGAARSAGEYLWFVDADDSVPATGLEALVRCAQRSGADVVIGASTVVGGSSRAPTTTSVRWTGTDALRAMLLGEIRGQLWDKLIAGRIVRAVEIPRSRVHSDVALVSRCLAASTSVVRIEDLVYTYTVRSDSIIGSARRRADSLRTVERVVADAAVSAGVDPGREIAYYRARFIGLSMIRDAAAGGYSRRDASALLAEARRRIGLRALRLSARRREWRVGATLLLAALWPRAFVLARRWARVRR
ncbi:MAG: glycosyltransferase family A protein [Rhodococcus sp. (in: high G+C Gram-positive bacteria)]